VFSWLIGDNLNTNKKEEKRNDTYIKFSVHHACLV